MADGRDLPLLRRIADAIQRTEPTTGRLRVSVASELKWEKSARGDEVLVRWLCWSLNDGDREVVEPEFEVVGKDVTRVRLAHELPQVFPDIEVVVDEDIDI